MFNGQLLFNRVMHVKLVRIFALIMVHLESNNKNIVFLILFLYYALL